MGEFLESFTGDGFCGTPSHPIDLFEGDHVLWVRQTMGTGVGTFLSHEAERNSPGCYRLSCYSKGL